MTTELCMAGPARARGFTLLELLIVTAILGLLAAIAIPAYSGSVLRSQRAEARIQLITVASDLERFFASNNRYITDATPLQAPATAGRTLTTTNGFYLISVAAGDTGIDSSFVATATAQGEQLADACHTLTVTGTGVRGAGGASVEECWRH